MDRDHYMPRDAPEYLTVTDVAVKLGVSPARIRQLIDVGYAARDPLPPPIKAGPKATVWSPGVIDAKIASDRGETTCFYASTRTPGRLLQRVFDRVVPLALDRRTGDLRRCHVRVFAEAGEVPVVIVGSLQDVGPSVINAAEDYATAINEQILKPLNIRGDRAVWFAYQPSSEGQGEDQLLMNILLRPNSDHPQRRWLPAARRSQDTPAGYSLDTFLGSSFAHVERLLGQPLEAYPGSSYRSEIIEGYQRAGRVVEVESPQALALHDALRDLAILDQARAGSDSECGHISGYAADVLADDLSAQLRAHRTWPDHILTPHRENPVSWPTTWAVELTPATFTVAEQALMNRYDLEDRDDIRFEFANTPAGASGYKSALKRINHLMLAVDQWSDQHDQRLHDALEHARSALRSRINTADPDDRIDPGVGYAIRSFRCAGSHDEDYLNTINWAHDATSADRRRRMYAKIAWQEQAADFGTDPQGRLVALVHFRDEDFFYVEWPTIPDINEQVAPGVMLVADGQMGDRPVYLIDPDGQIELLPHLRPIFEWNFGYAGGGPGALATAICRHLRRTEGLQISTSLLRWVEDMVDNSPAEELKIPWDEIRAAA